MAKSIKINIKFPSAKELKSDLDKVLKSVENSDLKINLNTSELTKDLSTISKSLEQIKAQVKSINFNNNGSIGGTEKLASGLSDISKAADKANSSLANVTVSLDKDNEIKKQVNTYVDSVGVATKETMAWSDVVDSSGKKIGKTFETVGTVVTRNIEKINNLKGTMQKSLTDIDLNKGFTGIDSEVINRLQNQLNTLSTDTSIQEFEELKSAINNLSSSDATIVKLQNEITKYANKISALKDNYGDLVPKEELDVAMGKILQLSSTIDILKQGGTVTQNGLKKMLDDASNSMNSLATATSKANSDNKFFEKNLVDIQRLNSASEKHQLTLDKLISKYKNLVPEEELNEAIATIQKLNDTANGLKLGENIGKADLNKVFDDATNSMRNLSNATDKAYRTQKVYNSEVISFGSALKNAATNVGFYSILYDGVQAVKTGFKSGVEQVIAMDTALADLNKVVSLSNYELVRMRDTAVSIGEELGRSAIDVANSQAQFGRMYKDMATINSLVETSIIGANTMGENITSSEVAEGLTSVMSSLQLEASSALSIINSLNEVQNNYKISSRDLLSALMEIGSVSKIAGANLNELNGYVTAIEQSTSKSGNEIGTSLNSIFSRVYRTGLGGIEAEGKPEKALNAIGVAVRDLEGNFRPINSILSDLNVKWGELSETQRIYTAQQVAGEVFAWLYSNV